VDRPKWRTTLSYRLTPRLQAGVEVNAAVGEVDPIANWFALTETDRLPAVIFGTSSDRIGTPKGTQAYYVTFSKQVGNYPVAPYFSVNYSSADRGFNVPFGASIQLGQQFTLTPMNDGHASHTMLTWSGKHESVTLIAAWNRRFGISFGYAF
jgi:hypothetical protein